MAHARWYPTALRLNDGRVLAFSGNSPLAEEVEAFDGGAWAPVSGANRTFGELYPGTHLLPSGEIFYSRTGWAAASGTPTAYLTLTGSNSGSWTDYGQQQFYDRQEGMSVLIIDTTVTPLHTSLYVFGGGVSGIATARNNSTAEVIEFSGGIARVGLAAYRRHELRPYQCERGGTADRPDTHYRRPQQRPEMVTHPGVADGDLRPGYR